MHFSLVMALAASASHFRWVAALSIRLTEREMPAVLSLPVDYHSVSQAKLQNRNVSPTVQADTVLVQGIPVVSVTVGTPPQALQLAVDIQNSFVSLLVSNNPDLNCSDDEYCALMGYFAPGKSISFGSMQPPESDPTVVYEDTMTVGDQPVYFVPMKLNSFYPGDYSRLGMAPRSSFPFSLLDKIAIRSPSFSLWSDPSRNNQGYLLFGGVNEAMYEGPLQAFSFPGDGDVSLPVAAVVVESSGNSTVGPTTSRHNLADSPVALLSTTDIYTFLPNDTVQQIYADLGITPVFEFNTSFGFVDCARLSSENRTVSLVFGNATISVPWSALIQRSGSNTCQLTIVPYNPYLSVPALGSQPQIGVTFLQYMYLAVDYDNMFAAVAPLNPNPGPDHILEIGNGPRIPDADGQFPATIATYLIGESPTPTPTPTSTTEVLSTTTTASSAAERAVTFKPRAVDITVWVTGTILAIFYLIM